MDFDKYWDSMVARNPMLSNPDHTLSLTSDNLKRLLKQCHVTAISFQHKISKDRNAYEELLKSMGLAL